MARGRSSPPRVLWKLWTFHEIAAVGDNEELRAKGFRYRVIPPRRPLGLCHKLLILHPRSSTDTEANTVKVRCCEHDVMCDGTAV